MTSNEEKPAGEEAQVAEEKPAGEEAVWERASAYLAGGDPEKQALATAVDAVIGGATGRPIYVAKLTPNGYRNQVWQGKGLTELHDVMVLLDQKASRDGIVREAQTRLNPPKDNGFDAVVVARKANGGWEPYGVIEYEHADVGAGVAAESPGIFITKVPDPGVANADLPGGVAGAPDKDLDPAEVILHLDEAKNVVLEGPPGTGKTRMAFIVANQLAGGALEACRLETLLGEETVEAKQAQLKASTLVWEFVQMHPSYSYEDFVRGQRTDPDAVGFALRTVDGILPTMCRVAALRGEKPTLLIIDEINRCNLSTVLGETVFAIDPAFRNRSVSLQYDGRDGSPGELAVPDNLFILATMNTADRSIAMLDFAIRRRFRYLYMGPSSGAIARHYDGQPRRLRAVDLFDAFRGVISERDLEVGHSFFIVDEQGELDDKAWAAMIVRNVIHEVRPLLREYAEEGWTLHGATLEASGGQLDLLKESDAYLSDNLEAWLTAPVEQA